MAELEYHVLPQGDAVAALNILREAAGLEPWPGYPSMQFKIVWANKA